ncbi:MAG: hypothetical protein Kow0069_31980 [Promethearchaeota archaeon]
MLVVRDEAGRNHKLWVVDCHTHVGAEEVIEYGRPTRRKNSPHQVLDFYTRVHYELVRAWQGDPGRFAFKLRDFVAPTPFLGPYARAAFGDRYGGWFVDQFVAFPFNDARRDEVSPQFRVPNDLLLKRMNNPAFAGRMLGFFRVNPLEGDAAVAEVRRGIRLGARGLKLHPISQGFLDQIDHPGVREVLKVALNGRLPVIVDCRFVKTAEEVYATYQEIRDEVRNPDHGVILAHSGMEFDKPSLYEVLADPHVFGDTSGIRSADVAYFLGQAHAHDPEGWHRSVCFGTDYNYFSEPQALDLISYLFSRDFFERTGASLEQVQAVLAGNVLRLVHPRLVAVAGHDAAQPASDGAAPPFERWARAAAVRYSLLGLKACRAAPLVVSSLVDRLAEWMAGVVKSRTGSLLSFEPLLGDPAGGTEPPSFAFQFRLGSRPPKLAFLLVDPLEGGNGEVQETEREEYHAFLGAAALNGDAPAERNPRVRGEGSFFHLHGIASLIDPASFRVLAPDGLDDFFESFVQLLEK